MIPVLPWIPVCSKPEVGMSVPTSGASSHTPCTPTLGSMPKPRASNRFTFRSLTRLHPAWAGRIMTTCKSHTDRLTRVQKKLLCSEKSKRATAFLHKSITCFSLQIDHHPCNATQDLREFNTTAKLMGTLRAHIGMDVILTESYLQPKVVRRAVAEIANIVSHEDP